MDLKNVFSFCFVFNLVLYWVMQGGKEELLCWLKIVEETDKKCEC